ncbi:hypothetical protein VTK73DRAFT_8703 [Phialemonium thermophilum]|uniref:Uncharacterized protein n=1 Tax=Phialemonium thermophilum TaxID=223376 RepID=A0ABR3W751_9PEZI
MLQGLSQQTTNNGVPPVYVRYLVHLDGPEAEGGVGAIAQAYPYLGGFHSLNPAQQLRQVDLTTLPTHSRQRRHDQKQTSITFCKLPFTSCR